MQLRALTLFIAVANLGAGALAGVFVLVVQDHFGVFLAVAAGGAIIGAALAARSGERFGRFAVMVTGFLGQAGACLVFVFAPNAWVAALAWSALAGASTLAGVLSAGTVQLVVPEHLMGRVLSAKKMLPVSLLPLGSLVRGVLGRVDLRVPAVFAALVSLALVAMGRSVVVEMLRQGTGSVLVAFDLHTAAFASMGVWGGALAVATVAYAVRRRAECEECGRGLPEVVPGGIRAAV